MRPKALPDSIALRFAAATVSGDFFVLALFILRPPHGAVAPPHQPPWAANSVVLAVLPPKCAARVFGQQAKMAAGLRWTVWIMTVISKLIYTPRVYLH